MYNEKIEEIKMMCFSVFLWGKRVILFNHYQTQVVVVQ